MPDSTRIHSLDVLRGIAMILGIFLHGAIAYKAGFPYGELIHDKDAEYYFFDWLHLLINSFRMQLFFLLGGFFAILLIKKIGTQPFIKNRIKRIALPLALAYLTILPATLVPVVYYQHMAGDPWAHVKEFLINFYLFRKFSGLIHLWFLYDLVLFYGFTLTALIILRKFEPWNNKFSAFIARIGPASFVVICILACGLITLLYETPVLTIWTGLITPLAQLLYYGFFFFIGWQLESNRKMLTRFSGFYKTFLLVALIISLVNHYLLNIYSFEVGMSGFTDLIFRFSFAIQTIFLVFGLIGFFNTNFSEASRYGKYLAVSAYWVYLIHNPIVLLTQLCLLDSIMPGVLRFPVVIIVAATGSYLSYHYVIRNSWVGTLLNGKNALRK